MGERLAAARSPMYASSSVCRGKSTDLDSHELGTDWLCDVGKLFHLSEPQVPYL